MLRELRASAHVVVAGVPRLWNQGGRGYGRTYKNAARESLQNILYFLSLVAYFSLSLFFKILPRKLHHQPFLSKFILFGVVFLNSSSLQIDIEG